MERVWKHCYCMQTGKKKSLKQLGSFIAFLMKLKWQEPFQMDLDENNNLNSLDFITLR